MNRLFIIAHPLHAGGGAVVGTRLIEGLLSSRPDVRSLISVPASDIYQERLRRFSDRIEFVRCPRANGFGRLLWEQFDLARIARSYRPDAIVGLANGGFAMPCAPQAIFCQNAYYCYPLRAMPWMQRTSLPRRLVQRLALSVGLAASSGLIAQTGIMLGRLRATYGFSGPTMVLPSAVCGEIQEAGLWKPRARPRLRAVYVSRYYPHKNHEVICDAVRGSATLRRIAKVTFTVSPSDHPRVAGIIAAASEFPEVVENIGPVDIESLATLYADTDLALVPSMLESLSGTYLEAMSLGIPIVAADTDFARETCGDAAVYADPSSASAWASAIVALSRDPVRQVALSEAGLRRIRDFPQTWDQVGGELAAFLEQLVHPRPAR